MIIYLYFLILLLTKGTPLHDNLMKLINYNKVED